jgi:hypothetical protein
MTGEASLISEAWAVLRTGIPTIRVSSANGADIEEKVLGSTKLKIRYMSLQSIRGSV